MRGWRSIFQSFPYSGSQTEALRTVMVCIVAVALAKTINFSYTITLSTCSIYVSFRPMVLGSSFCITINQKFNCDAETTKARTVALKPT